MKVITTPMVTRQPTVTAGDSRNCPRATARDVASACVPPTVARAVGGA